MRPEAQRMKTLPALALSLVIPALYVVAADKPKEPEKPAGKPAKVDFVAQIKPLFDANCAKCHGVRPTKAYSMLTKAKAFTPGESEEPPIVPGKADQSLIVILMKAKDPEGRMPQKKPAMKPDEIALIERWINEGADWPEKVQLTPPPEEKEKE
jgi:mono/diheme cytochrome c family protein